MNEINDGLGDQPNTEDIIEYIEEAGFSEKDQEDLDKLLADRPEVEYHSLFEVWQKTLATADRPDNRQVTPKWAMSIISQYAEIRFADMNRYVEVYFDLLQEMCDILDEVIAGDKDIFDVKDAEEDTVQNRDSFIKVLTDWQLLLLTRELEWTPADPDAAVQIAALSEIQKLFFGSGGLTGHLEAIKFEFDDEDRENLSVALEARRDELMGAK